MAISSSAHASGSHASSDGESYQSPLTGDQSHEQNIELTRQHQVWYSVFQIKNLNNFVYV